MNKFSFQSLVNFNIRKVFDWHKNTFALERLTPPWDLVNVSKRHYINSYPLINGGIIEMRFLNQCRTDRRAIGLTRNIKTLDPHPRQNLTPLIDF